MYGRKEVSKKEIFSQLNDYDLFHQYCAGFNKSGTKFSSEFRDDRNPSCVVGRYGSKLYYKDFAEPDNYDALGYIMRKYNTNFVQTLNMINRDFNLGLDPTCSLRDLPMTSAGITHGITIESIPVAPKIISIEKREWKAQDGKFWKDRYGITQATLRKYRVVPIKRYWTSGKDGHRTVTVGFYAYAFFCGYIDDGREAWKIYQPYKTQADGKWYSNVPGSFLQGYDELPHFGDNLIITAALKCVMVLDQAGWPAIAPHGENFKIPREFMVNLLRRFPNIIVLYDNDEAGKRAAASLAKEHPELKVAFLPEGTKDPSDFVETYDYDTLDQVIHEMVEDGMESNNT